MPTLNTFADAGDGYIYSGNAAYASARETYFAGEVLDSNGLYLIGQNTGYTCAETFLAFNTSSIADTDIITSVTMSITLTTDGATIASFTAEARNYNWGGTLTSADYRAGSAMSAITRLATLSITNTTTLEVYQAFTEDGTNFINATNMKTGTVYIMIASNQQAAGNAPSTFEYRYGYSTLAAGTTADPKISIVSIGGALVFNNYQFVRSVSAGVISVGERIR